MRGRNTLTLNQATMIDALQLWVKHVMKDPAPKVVGVKKTAHTDLYEIQLDDCLIEPTCKD